MEETTSREKILKRVRNALISKSENPYQDIGSEQSVYKKMDDALDITFAQEFTQANGKFIYCENYLEFLQNLKALISEKEWEAVFCREEGLIEDLGSIKINYSSAIEDLPQMQVGISSCESLIARLGSILVSSKQSGGRKINAFPEIHIVFAFSSQLVADIKDGLNALKQSYPEQLPSMSTLITGPSRTADIEKTLVMGAHGPKELYLFFIDDSIN